MKKSLTIGLALAMLWLLAPSIWFAIVPAPQTSLTGSWSGRMRTGVPLALDLESDDSDLHGTLTRNRRSSSLVDGRVTDDGVENGRYGGDAGERTYQTPSKLETVQRHAWGVPYGGATGTSLAAHNAD